MLNFDFFPFFIIMRGAIIKGAILFSAGGHSEEPWRAFGPFRKVIRAAWFFHVSVQINISSTINMQRKDSIKSLPSSGLLSPFMN